MKERGFVHGVLEKFIEGIGRIIKCTGRDCLRGLMGNNMKVFFVLGLFFFIFILKENSLMISLKGLEFLNGKMDRIILDIGREGKWMAKGKYALRIIR